ncbi:MAG: transglycosylase SLT domain-containing protein [Thiogranum sp.]|jgi:membrane-bound lytic murein transglycosylase D
MSTLRANLAALILLLAIPLERAAGVTFERPDSLQPAIGFWTRVYGEIDSLSGFVHDSDNLSVVYETLRFNWYDSAQVQERRIEEAVANYQSALHTLASGKRKDLSPREQKVLALWGDDASAETLAAAANRIRFQRGQADRIREGIIRARAWEQRIRKRLRDAGLPEGLAVLPYVESSYNPRAESHAGAVGLWQFTRFTGRHYLRVDEVLDERTDPVRSTDGAVRLLTNYYSKLHSWPLTITAYNHGLSGLRRAVQDTGSTDIGDIVRTYTAPRFGFASRNYYAAFLAVGDVTRNAERYFGKPQRQRTENYWTVKLPNYIAMDSLLRELAVDADVVQTLNPALQAAVWSNKKYVPKGYLLRLPATTRSATITALLTRTQGHAQQIPDFFYRVKPGDTLSGIALRHNHSVSDLVTLNNLRSEDHIRAGQSLRLYSKVVPEAIVTASMESAEDDGEDPLLPRAAEAAFEAVAAVP